MRLWPVLLLVAACGDGTFSGIDGGDDLDASAGSVDADPAAPDADPAAPDAYTPDADETPQPDAAPGTPDAGGGGTPDGGTTNALPWLAGVNLSGAEFGEGSLPGTYGTHYIYPDQGEVDYFKGEGMNVVRVNFRWERLQRSLNAAFNATELGRLHTFVDAATASGVYVILDPHNYARYVNDLIGSSAVPRSAFADFWGRLADEFKDDPRVIFGLVNEPHDMVTEDWLAAANDAISAIRGTGATNLILVPGNAWTGGWSWSANWYGSSNATTMDGIVDSGDNYAIEVHQYLDEDYSGSHAACTQDGSSVVAGLTTWARDQGVRVFLGEIGGADNTDCAREVDELLDHLDANRDVWMGWAWWAAGPWWGDYMLTLEPNSDGSDQPQMEWLRSHLE
jgi:endoglucanase